MKKVIYKGLYNILLTLSNHFNNRFLTRCKLFLGTTLLLLTANSCDDPEEPQVMCYDPAPPEVPVETQPSLPPSPEENQADFMKIQK